MKPRTVRLIFLLCLGALLSAACAAPGPANTEIAASAPDRTSTEATVGLTPAGTSATAPAGPTLLPVKSALEATDPSTVQLASGEPQLVEFFAFW